MSGCLPSKIRLSARRSPIDWAGTGQLALRTRLLTEFPPAKAQPKPSAKCATGSLVQVLATINVDNAAGGVCGALGQPPYGFGNLLGCAGAA